MPKTDDYVIKKVIRNT